MLRILALLCVLMLTACDRPAPVPVSPEPNYTFTEIELVAVADSTDEVMGLRQPMQLMDRGYAESVFSTLPSSKKLMKAYETVRDQHPQQIWIGFVYQTCLPPLKITPYISAESLRFNVVIDPDNQYVDCVREPRPILGIVGVNQ